MIRILFLFISWLCPLCVYTQSISDYIQKYNTSNNSIYIQHALSQIHSTISLQSVQSKLSNNSMRLFLWKTPNPDEKSWNIIAIYKDTIQAQCLTDDTHLNFLHIYFTNPDLASIIPAESYYLHSQHVAQKFIHPIAPKHIEEIIITANKEWLHIPIDALPPPQDSISNTSFYIQHCLTHSLLPQQTCSPPNNKQYNGKMLQLYYDYNKKAPFITPPIRDSIHILIKRLEQGYLSYSIVDIKHKKLPIALDISALINTSKSALYIIDTLILDNTVHPDNNIVYIPPQVPDSFRTHFYQQLYTHKKRDIAMRSAKLELLKQGLSPNQWASPTIYGSTFPLHMLKKHYMIPEFVLLLVLIGLLTLLFGLKSYQKANNP